MAYKEPRTDRQCLIPVVRPSVPANLVFFLSTFSSAIITSRWRAALSLPYTASPVIAHLSTRRQNTRCAGDTGTRRPHRRRGTASAVLWQSDRQSVRPGPTCLTSHSSGRHDGIPVRLSHRPLGADDDSSFRQSSSKQLLKHVLRARKRVLTRDVGRRRAV